MVKISLFLDRRREHRDGKYPLRISVSHKSRTAYISTGVHLRPTEFVKGRPRSKIINDEVDKLMEQYEVRLMNKRCDMLNVTELRDYLRNGIYNDTPGIFKVIDEMCASRASNTSINFNTVKQRLVEFTSNDNPSLDIINRDFVEKFSQHLKDGGLKQSSITTYLSKLSSVYNYAVKKRYVSPAFINPFSTVKITMEKKGRIESLTITELKRLRDGDFGRDNEVRDLFMISFYLIGMNPNDIYDCAPAKEDRIRYERHKTGKMYDIKIQPELKPFIEKYGGVTHLFHFAEKYSSFRSYYHNASLHFRKLRQQLNNDNMTFYWARYSWATIAYSIGIPKDTISQALGHSFGVSVTDRYIDYDYRIVDEANRKVLDAIR